MSLDPKDWSIVLSSGMRWVAKVERWMAKPEEAWMRPGYLLVLHAIPVAPNKAELRLIAEPFLGLVSLNSIPLGPDAAIIPVASLDDDEQHRVMAAIEICEQRIQEIRLAKLNVSLETTIPKIAPPGLR